MVLDLTVDRDASGLRVLGFPPVGRGAGDAQTHEGGRTVAIDGAPLGVLGDGPGHSGLTGAGAGGHRGALTGGKYAVPVPVHPAGDLGVAARAGDLLTPLLADIGPDDVVPVGGEGVLVINIRGVVPRGVSAVGDVVIMVRQGTQTHDGGVRGGHVPLVRCRTQVVPVSGVALIRCLAAGDVALSAVRQLPAAPGRLERAAGDTVALRRVAVVHVGDDTEGDGASSASVDLDVAGAHVAQQHDRGGAVAVGDLGAALGVVRAHLDAGPVANRGGDGDLADDGVRDASRSPGALQQAVGDVLGGDVGDRGNGDVLLLAVRDVPARGLGVGDDHALHRNLHLVGEVFQLALRRLGGGGHQVGAALDLELLCGGVPQVGNAQRQV